MVFAGLQCALSVSLGALAPFYGPMMAASLPTFNSASLYSQQGSLSSAGFPLAVETKTHSGFRLEGSPEIESVFGNIQELKETVDRFYHIGAVMEGARVSFNTSSNAALKALSNHPSGCPLGAVSNHYFRAKQSNALFNHQGALYEQTYERLDTLARLGESSALPPVDQLRLNKTRSLYRRSLQDMRDMQGTYNDQLTQELRYRGCKEQSMLARASIGIPTEVAPRLKELPKRRLERTKSLRDPTLASAKFSISNKSCKDELVLFVDGDRFAAIPAGEDASFSLTEGRHNLCLFGEDDTQATCGAPGTLRSVLIHDGWSMTRHCEKNE